MALHAAVKVLRPQGEGANIAASPPSTEPDVVPPSVANDTSPVLAQSKLAPGAAAETEADGQRAERLARLKISAERWTVRVVALLAGVGLWHYASATGLGFYVRFDNIPGPFRVGAALLQHLQQASFYMHIAVSLE